MSSIKYRPDIDGLRAIAVLPVVLFHCGVSAMSGGFVGVDVFFVISGFLITNAIIKDLEDDRFSISDFYVRRIRRILPALIFTVFVSAIAAIFILDQASQDDFGKSVFSVSIFASNFFFWKSSGYFEPAALTKPLLHTWSLAVEEQFYIIMPVALGLFWRFAPKLLRPAVVLAALSSLALSVAALKVAPTAAFFLLPTRGWELLAGSLLALYPTLSLPRVAREFLGISGFALIVFSVFNFTEATPFPGFAAAAPVTGAVLLILVGSAGGSGISKILSLKPLVAVGLISYSLYLVHWPLVVFTRYALLRDPNSLEIGALVVSSLVLATASWWFVEKPFRLPAKSNKKSRTLIGGLLALGALAGAGASYAMIFRAPAIQMDNTPTSENDIWMNGKCFLMDQPADAWAGEICLRTASGKPRAILWGDSFAAHYVPGILAEKNNLDRDFIQYTYAGCPPILSYASYARPGCQEFNRNIIKVANEYDADSVIMSARWDQLRSRGLDGLQDTVDQLRNAGLRVYVIGQSPMFAFDVSILESRQAGATSDGQSAAWFAIFDEGDFSEVQVQSAGATFIDPYSAYCSDELCNYKLSGKPLFFDYGHLSNTGSSYAVTTYFPFRTGSLETALKSD